METCTALSILLFFLLQYPLLPRSTTTCLLNISWTSGLPTLGHMRLKLHPYKFYTNLVRLCLLVFLLFYHILCSVFIQLPHPSFYDSLFSHNLFFERFLSRSTTISLCCSFHKTTFTFVYFQFCLPTSTTLISVSHPTTP